MWSHRRVAIVVGGLGVCALLFGCSAAGPLDSSDSGNASDGGATATADGDSDGTVATDGANVGSETGISDGGNPPEDAGTHDSSIPDGGRPDTGQRPDGSTPIVHCNFKNISKGVCRTAKLDQQGNCQTPNKYQAKESKCDGSDNDFDGVTDENCACNYKQNALGVCSDARIGKTSGKCDAPKSYEKNETTCEEKDNDCDGKTDEGLKKKKFYFDIDGDGYGNSNRFVKACSPPRYHVAKKGDCDDVDRHVHPGATEKCNGIDEDCDGKGDRRDQDARTWCQQHTSGFQCGNYNGRTCCTGFRNQGCQN